MSIIHIQNVTAKRTTKTIFKNLNWTFKAGEQWAIIGQTGAGKSSFIDLLMGELDIEKGDIAFSFLTQTVAEIEDYIDFEDYISVVKFQNSHLNYAEYYYQQRFQSTDTEGVITVIDFLNEGFLGDVRDYPILKLLMLNDLLDLEIVKLSNGQTRKLYIAKALLEQPKILVLDNPFLGLDVEARELLKKVINTLILEGLPIILICNYVEEIPSKITHILWMDHFTVKEILSLSEAFKIQFSHTATLPTIPDFPTRKQTKPFDFAVKMNNITVKYDDLYIVKDINWAIKKGEKWALLGGNGSGKSTLLSLIYGDHPQAYSTKIILFDRVRGTGESIWDIKDRIGYVSPELHLYFTDNTTNYDLVTNAQDNMPQGTRSRDKLTKQLFKYYGLTSIIHHNFQDISFGEQRLVLFIRALVLQPDVLILDEPFQGLDAYNIQLSKQLLDVYCQDKTLIFVTHYASEIPDIVDSIFNLENGLGFKSLRN